MCLFFSEMQRGSFLLEVPALLCMHSVTAQYVVLGQARMRPRKKKKNTGRGTTTQKCHRSLDSSVYPKGNKDQSWGHWSALCQGNYTLYSCGFGAVQISMLWTRAQKDNLCQPPLPTRLQGVGHSNLQSPPAASVLTNALQVLLLYHQARTHSFSVRES